MRALLVDDSRAMRSILAGLLRGLGQTDIIEAGHGREGLARLKEGATPDLALVDWNMPEMDGLQFIKHVRAEPAYREMKIMMVTTETESRNVAQALALGADEYIMKPFTAEMLQDKLRLLGLGTG